MNVKAGIFAAAGAVLGGVAGAVVQGARNKPIEDALLVSASLGAILGASLAPKTASATPAPAPGT